jgi:hypothetical protein
MVSFRVTITKPQDLGVPARILRYEMALYEATNDDFGAFEDPPQNLVQDPEIQDVGENMLSDPGVAAQKTFLVRETELQDYLSELFSSRVTLFFAVRAVNGSGPGPWTRSSTAIVYDAGSLSTVAHDIAEGVIGVSVETSPGYVVRNGACGRLDDFEENAQATSPSACVKACEDAADDRLEACTAVTFDIDAASTEPRGIDWSGSAFDCRYVTGGSWNLAGQYYSEGLTSESTASRCMVSATDLSLWGVESPPPPPENDEDLDLANPLF